MTTMNRPWGKVRMPRRWRMCRFKFMGNGVLFGVGEGTNIDQAAVRAIVAGLNRWASRK